MSTALGSFYSVEEERENSLLELKKLCLDVMERLKPNDGKTYCNVAVRTVAEAMGCKDFRKDEMANQMVETMSRKWKQVDAAEALAHAQKGCLAVAGRQYEIHGHVAVIWPSLSLGESPSWKKSVPYVANVGKENGILLVSRVFPVKENEPYYFIFQSDQQSGNPG